MADKLQALTGISADYYLAHDLTITKVAFARELLKDKGRITRNLRRPLHRPGPSPRRKVRRSGPGGHAAIMPMIAEHFKSLGVTWPLAYRDAAPGANAWTWSPTGGAGGPFLDYDYPAQLKKAFAANPKFRLMVGTGIYDLTTTDRPGALPGLQRQLSEATASYHAPVCRRPHGLFEPRQPQGFHGRHPSLRRRRRTGLVAPWHERRAKP
jgi:hypothetical protein